MATIFNFTDVVNADEAQLAAAVMLGPVAVAIEADHPYFQHVRTRPAPAVPRRPVIPPRRTPVAPLLTEARGAVPVGMWVGGCGYVPLRPLPLPLPLPLLGAAAAAGCWAAPLPVGAAAGLGGGSTSPGC